MKKAVTFEVRETENLTIKRLKGVAEPEECVETVTRFPLGKFTRLDLKFSNAEVRTVVEKIVLKNVPKEDHAFVNVISDAGRLSVSFNPGYIMKDKRMDSILEKYDLSLESDINFELIKSIVGEVTTEINPVFKSKTNTWNISVDMHEVAIRVILDNCKNASYFDLINLYKFRTVEYKENIYVCMLIQQLSTFASYIRAVDSKSVQVSHNGVLELGNKHVLANSMRISLQDVSSYLWHFVGAKMPCNIEFMSHVDKDIFSSLSDDDKNYYVPRISGRFVRDAVSQVNKFPVITTTLGNFLTQPRKVGSLLDSYSKPKIDTKSMTILFPEIFSKDHNVISMILPNGIGLVPSLADVLYKMSGLGKGYVISFNGDDDGYNVTISRPYEPTEDVKVEKTTKKK